jgi:hypothetical protein
MLNVCLMSNNGVSVTFDGFRPVFDLSTSILKHMLAFRSIYWVIVYKNKTFNNTKGGERRGF